MQNQLKSLVVSIFLSLVSASTAQAVKLEPFIPPPLPATTMPKPVPPTMVTLPSGVTFGNGSCQPSVKGILVPVVSASSFHYEQVSAKIQNIVKADQAARTGDVDWNQVIKDDHQRRQQLFPLIPWARTSEDFTGIGLVFQHGSCLEHFLFAHKMAQNAMLAAENLPKNSPEYVQAASLYAVTLDRALMTAGRAQKYGTQYFGVGDNCVRLYVTDTKTTDEERQKYYSPTLQEAIDNAKSMSVPGCR